jgi:hypothetical protein
MFGQIGGLLGDLNKLKELAQNEDFRVFLQNPKVESLMKNEKFKQALQQKNMFNVMANTEFQELIKDPEVRKTLEKLNRNAKSS